MFHLTLILTKTLGFPSKKIEILISILIVTTVIIGIQAAGVILISAMLISPAVAARQWTDKLSIMVILAAFLEEYQVCLEL